MALKPPRLYVPLDVTYSRDPKVVGLSIQAELLWIRLLCEAKMRPDRLGFLTKSDVKSAAGEQIKSPIMRADQLVDVGLLEHAEMGRVKGYCIPSWSSWNMTESEHDKARQARITGGLISAHRRGQHKANPSEACPECPTAVAQVDERAIQWAAAMREAVAVQRRNLNGLERLVDHFAELWNQWKFTDSEEPIPLPSSWRSAVRVFVEDGLNADDMEYCIAVAMDAHWVSDTFPYCMGVCRNHLANRASIARELMEG